MSMFKTGGGSGRRTPGDWEPLKQALAVFVLIIAVTVALLIIETFPHMVNFLNRWFDTHPGQGSPPPPHSKQG